MKYLLSLLPTLRFSALQDSHSQRKRGCNCSDQATEEACPRWTESKQGFKSFLSAPRFPFQLICYMVLSQGFSSCASDKGHRMSLCGRECPVNCKM